MRLRVAWTLLGESSLNFSRAVDYKGLDTSNVTP